MFCEKCGYKNNDNARFCEKCGATLTAPNAQPQQPAPQQPAPAPAPAQPAAPKKPMDPKTKKIILFSAIGAGALAVILIVIFAIIVPVVKNAGAIDITKYYTVKFDGVTEGEKDQSVLDGKIEGKFTWDYAKFAKENNMSESKAESLLYNVESCMDIEYFDNKGEETYSRYFDSAFEGDTYKVTFTWPKKDATFRSDRVALQHIEHYENEAGVLFKHNDATKEFKLGEALMSVVRRIVIGIVERRRWITLQVIQRPQFLLCIFRICLSGLQDGAKHIPACFLLLLNRLLQVKLVCALRSCVCVIRQVRR